MPDASIQQDAGHTHIFMLDTETLITLCIESGSDRLTGQKGVCVHTSCLCTCEHRGFYLLF